MWAPVVMGAACAGAAMLVLAFPPATPTGQRPAPDTPQVPALPAPAVAPHPILMVPGWFRTGAAFAVLRARLVSAGWPEDHVVAITFRDPTGSNHEHAREIAAAVDELLACTGSEEVDIIAHSMGGLAARWYMRDHPGKVRRVVFLATPHRGTYSAYLAFGEGRDEMIPENPFLDSLNAASAVPAGVGAMTIRTLLDTHIVPGESGTLSGVPDVVVCCPTHEAISRDPEVFDVVAGYLRRDPKP